MFLLASAIEKDRQPAGPSVSRSQSGSGRWLRAKVWGGEGGPLWPGDGYNVIVRAGMKSALTK